MVTDLKSITDVIGDGLHGTPEYDDNGQFFFINGNNLNETIEIKSDTKRVNEEEYNKYKKPLNSNTILLSINGTLGNFARYNNEPVILGKSACYINIKQGYNVDYISWFLKSKVKSDFERNATGTTIKNISLKQIRELQINLPDDTVQEKIAKTLNSIQAKIDINNKINRNLEDQAKLLYKSWFVDFDNNNGEMPYDWHNGTVEEIIELHDSKRKPLSGNERDKLDKIYPYHGATSIMDYVDDYLFDGIYLLLGEDGSVIDAEGYPILQYVFGKFWVNNHAHIITGKNGFSVEELYLLFSMTNVQNIVTGAVQLKISQQNLKKVETVIPTKQALKTFDEIIQPMFEKIRKLRMENDNLISLRESILPKLMSGELDVSQLEV